jgi:hypothetical protein
VLCDPSGGIIAGAAIRLTQSATQVSRTTTANEAGLFTFPAVVVGTYTVTVTRPGFKERKIENLGVNAFQQVALGQITLDIGASTESVTVTASAEQALVKDSAVRFATVQAKQVAEMPLAGRNWINLLKVIPGATPTNSNALNGREYTSTGYSDFKINGVGSQLPVNLTAAASSIRKRRQDVGGAQSGIDSGSFGSHEQLPGGIRHPRRHGDQCGDKVRHE